MYGENRVNNEINNIDADKEKDANRYVHKYINIVNDKISFLNNVSELTGDLMGGGGRGGGIDVNTSNETALKKLKDFKSHIVKLNNRFNLYIKQGKYVILKLLKSLNKIISNSSIITNEHNEDINNEIMCSNKIRYIILMKIMYCLFKILKLLNKET